MKLFFEYAVGVTLFLIAAIGIAQLALKHWASATGEQQRQYEYRQIMRDNINGLIVEGCNTPDDSPFLDVVHRNAITSTIQKYRSA